MKKGHNIKEVLERINEDKKHKTDYLVNLKSITIKEASDSVYPNIDVDHLTTSPHNLSDHSLNQLCGRLEIGTHYMNKCLPVSQNLVADNLNFWIN